jgi:hypothetical protein
MFYQNDSILSDELVFKLLSISMMIVERIQRTRSRTVKRKFSFIRPLRIMLFFFCSFLETIFFAGIAFAVALFSHVVNHTIIRLQNAFYQLHDARVKSNESDSEEEEERQQVLNSINERRKKK